MTYKTHPMPILPSLNSIKVGMAIVVDNDPYLVLEASFMRTAQRKPVMRTKLRNLKTGKVREVSFKPGDSVEEALVEKRKVQYLYGDEQFCNFMDKITFEQYAIPKESIGEKMKFLKEEAEVALIMFEGSVINADIPIKMELSVTSAAPTIRGDTAQGNVYKEATVETGALVHVPLFIKEGDRIIINTETGEYVGRANE